METQPGSSNLIRWVGGPEVRPCKPLPRLIILAASWATQPNPVLWAFSEDAYMRSLCTHTRLKAPIRMP